MRGINAYFQEVDQKSQATTDLSQHRPDELEAVAFTLNSRPRKTLGWKTPAEALDELLT